MIATQSKPKNDYRYESASEKELLKMWEDIKGGNVKSLNCSLIKAINENTPKEVEPVGKNLKQMWDSELCEWVPFDLWGAHFIVNKRKEYLSLRMWKPFAVQPDGGPILKGWHSMDSSYLNESLKEEGEIYHPTFCGLQDFYEMVGQDKHEKESQGRYVERGL